MRIWTKTLLNYDDYIVLEFVVVCADLLQSNTCFVWSGMSMFQEFDVTIQLNCHYSWV